MSRLTDAAARHRSAQHTSDFCADDVSRKKRALNQAVEAQTKADDELEAAARELAAARLEALGRAS